MHAFLQDANSSSLAWCIRRFQPCRSESLLLSDHGFDTVVHVLDEIDLRATESSLVGDIVDVIGRFRVLSMDASDLDVEFVGNSLEVCHFSTELRELNMDRCSKGSSEISWARSDVAKAFIVSETSDLLNLRSCNSKPGEDGSDVSALFH